MILCLLGDIVSVHCQRWATYLAERGHSVHVLSLGSSEIDNVIVHRLKPILPGKAGYVTALFQVKRLIDQIRPDIVHAHFASSYGLLGALCGFHPYIVSVWGADVYLFPRKSPLHRRLLEFNLSRADHVCSTSHVMARETRKYYERPITVTPFGVDCQLFKRFHANDNDSNEFVIGIVKALEEEYCPDILLRSFALVAQKYRERKELRLVFAGEGHLRNKLVRLAEELGVGELTQFLGFVPHARVPEVLNRFSVFVVVSQRESFGVTVLEASACSLPVIVSSIGGLPEVVQDGVTGIIVPPRDVEATAAAISRLIDDDQARHAMGVAGREFVLKNYEWNENGGRMERLYESLLRDCKTVHQPAC